jgi:deazaflavin-dependent oxidoreductase (nitroreductase family)
MNNKLSEPPKGWLKYFFKMPVYFARMGFLGWEKVFGLDWMLLITTGRKSGKKRYSMVDILSYEGEKDTYYIEVGFGRKSDWYQNIQANPIFEAQVYRRKFTAKAEELSIEKAADMMADFVKRRPLYARSVLKMVGITINSEEELRGMVSKMILLAIHPQE